MKIRERVSKCSLYTLSLTVKNVFEVFHLQLPMIYYQEIIFPKEMDDR
jgi:hypothetical protein